MKTYRGYTYRITSTTTDKQYERAGHVLTRTAQVYEIDGLKPREQRPFLTSQQDVKDFIDSHLDGQMPMKAEAGKRIFTARRNQDLTQQEVGESLGYSGETARITVARWESGTRPVPMDKIKALSALLHINALDLLP